MPARDAWGQVELMTKVARLYHEQGATQIEIARRLHLSQAKVSRLLSRAKAEGIIRTTVVTPPDVFVDDEDRLRDRFGLLDAVVVAPAPEGVDPALDLGRRAAPYLEATIGGPGALGVSTWSATLLAAAEALGRTSETCTQVVQMIGGHGDPATQARSTRLLTRLAEATGGVPVSLPAPGIVSSVAARDALLSDASIARVMSTWSELAVALVSIGSVDPSPMLRESGNAWEAADSRALSRGGAVGDICLRFFSANGEPVDSALNSRVMGIDLPTFRDVPRRLAIAGGHTKVEAIGGALRGGWVNVLVTDVDTARALLAAP